MLFIFIIKLIKYLFSDLIFSLELNFILSYLLITFVIPLIIITLKFIYEIKKTAVAALITFLDITIYNLISLNTFSIAF